MPLRRIFLQCLSKQTTYYQQHLLPPNATSLTSHFHSSQSLSLFRTFASSSSSAAAAAPDSTSSSSSKPQDPDPISLSLSSELLKNPSSDPLPIFQRLHLNFSHINPTPSLVLSTLNLSPDAGRTVLGFNHWLISNPSFSHSDETLSYFVDYFGRRKDFKATDEVLTNVVGIAGPKTLESAIDRLVRAGRPADAVSFFQRMESDYGLKRDKESLRLVVEKLCGNGYASHAEKMVKNLANEFFPDERMCDLLVKGWCVDGKLDEAERLAQEMYRGGFEIGATAYNAILDCLCKLCRKKEPFIFDAETKQLLFRMEDQGVPRNVETFNVLITNLCKMRRTSDAMELFHSMGEWGCYPDETTFLVLIRSLYQAARLGEGDEMIDRMRSAGYGSKLDKKAYYGFLKILCGIERIDHALSVFKKMKEDKCEPGMNTYDLLMGKLCAHNRLDRANALFNEARKRGVLVEPKAFMVDPRYLKKKVRVVKSEKKRETLPEKMARKRRRLKQIRLSFVKKPKRMMRRAF